MRCHAGASAIVHCLFQYPGISLPQRRRGRLAGWRGMGELRQTACKPGSVPARRRVTAIHLGRPLPGASRDRPGRRRGSAFRPPPERRSSRPYLVLLPVGFTVPPPSPGARCALAAPFHPYPRGRLGPRGRFAFCGTFPGVAPAGRYPAPCFRGARTFLPRTQGPRAAARPSGVRNLGGNTVGVKGASTAK